MSARRIAVVGAGAWGTALANVAARDGGHVMLWGRDAGKIAAIAAARENRHYLPGVRLLPNVMPTAAQDDLAKAEVVILAVPAQKVRETTERLAPVVAPDVPVVICAKGIEGSSGHFLSDVVRMTLPQTVTAVLSGPSFAADVARGLPTAVVLASPDGVLAATLAGQLSAPSFRIYHGDDMRGVEIGGAAKNVLAIACGMVAGRRLGESARAALVARGFAELTRFARAYGGRPETLAGLSGLGDLVLTATSAQSRNFAFGEALGRGRALADVMASGRLVEGAFTAKVLVEKALAKEVEMPVAAAVDAVIAGRLTVDAASEMLMMRPIKAE